MFKGKWTYITAAVAFLYGLVGLIFGFGDAQMNLNAMFIGSGLGGLRRAIK